ncbi:MAG: DUF885 domain-containing protein [Nocardioidaceae bacterium]
MNDDLVNPADELAGSYFAALLEAEPTWAHLLGDLRHAGSFERISRSAQDSLVETLRAFEARANRLREDGLDEQQRVTRAMVASDATRRRGLLEARLAEFAANPIFGTQVSLAVVVPMLAVADPVVAEAFIDKYAAIGTYFSDLAERHREGVAGGRTPARFAVEGTIAQVETWLSTPVERDPLLNTGAPPDGLDLQAWHGRLKDVIVSRVRPGLEHYRDVLRDEVLAPARPDDRVGLTWLEGGADDYAGCLRYFTTTDKTAQEIHDIGLSQVAGLAVEYAALGRSVLGTHDVPAIFEALRSDPALHYGDADALVAASKVALARAEKAMPAWFEVLPRAACRVEPTTTGAKAFYYPPSIDGARGGTFFINVSDPSAWGTFELEAVAYHEGVPGHHLQLAIASELTSLPELRKHSNNSAYAEGWGLYTERLSDEMGLYSSDVDRMGMLCADSLRACRLVVDTGMHALGWSRQQAVDYMVTNSPMTEGHVRAEIDRYALTPGQATSYMIGRLEIQRMRREAEERLGEGFDVRAFHSAVLDSGALPLDVLDRVVTSRLG